MTAIDQSGWAMIKVRHFFGGRPLQPRQPDHPPGDEKSDRIPDIWAEIRFVAGLYMVYEAVWLSRAVRIILVFLGEEKVSGFKCQDLAPRFPET